MSTAQCVIEPQELIAGVECVVFDCRFILGDPDVGEGLYREGHVPGAHYLHLERDLSGPIAQHGGRHPLPDPATFAARLARVGVTRDTAVIAYDDSRQAFACRLWWLMRAAGYRPPRLLNGGYQAYLQAGGKVIKHEPVPAAVPVEQISGFARSCDITGVREAQGHGALLIDSREPARYCGEEELIDPVAGHIPGALNSPWQAVTDKGGRLLDLDQQRAHWGDVLDAEHILVYCGSGVTACVNLFSLAVLGRHDAVLYAGSWSDWCSYLSNAGSP